MPRQSSYHRQTAPRHSDAYYTALVSTGQYVQQHPGAFLPKKPSEVRALFQMSQTTEGSGYDKKVLTQLIIRYYHR